MYLKYLKKICEIVYSLTNSNKTVKAFKDFTLAGPFLLHFREVIKARQKKWIKFWKHSSFVFFQFNYSNHQSGNSILIVFFFNRFFWCLIIYLLTLNIFNTCPKKTKVLFFSLKTNKCLRSSRRTQKDVDRTDL